MDNRVTDSLRSALNEHQRVSMAWKPETPPSATSAKMASLLPRDTNLAAEILGLRVSAATLPDLFARCVDIIHELDPPSIERLAGRKTHARRYVARRREDVHFRSPHLPTMETGSGWWISANVGEQQVTTAMRLLTKAADLQFGKDIIYPL
ncbi:hypothetical protein A9Q95_15675 [Rhodobacterales bacterium 59_46_T64]|nr:hypothetical protein A9Q95_15675 [Rhodobacterales bacterium 59_46_T64]